MATRGKNFRNKVQAPLFQPYGSVETPDSTQVRVLFKDKDGYVLIATGTTVPSDNENNYAKGCLFIDTNVGAGTTGLYENVGDTSNCNFDVIGAGGAGATTFIGLTDTPSNFTSSGLKLVRVNTGETALEYTEPTPTIITSLTEGNVIVGDNSDTGSSLDASGNAKIMVGNGTTITSVAISGDVSLANDGSTTVSGLTLGSDAQGDIYYRGSSALARLAAGTVGQALCSGGAGANPYWGTPNVANATSLANSLTCEAGGSDYTLDFGTAGGAYTLTIPAVSGSRTFAFINEAQTWSANQTFPQTGLLLQGGDSNSMNIKVNETLSAGKTLNIKINDTDRTIDLSGNLTLAGSFTTAGAWTHTGAHTLGITTSGNTAVTLPTSGTLATLAGSEEFTNKTLTSAVLKTGVSGTAVLDEDDMATDSDTQIATQQSIKAYVDSGTVTMTNKSIDCNGTGNAITNANGAELEPVALPSAGDGSDSVFGVELILVNYISNQAAAVDIYNSDAPFKFLVMDAWSINASASAGSWKLDNGTNDITNAVSVAASDTDVDRVTTVDDAYNTIASGGSLRIVPDGGGAMDAYIFVKILRLS